MIDPTMKPPHRDSAPRPAPASAIRRWLLLACLCLGAFVLAPSAARAQEEEIKHDARLDGYQGTVTVPNDSTALMWLLFIFLAVVAMAVLFKDAKRTHLD